ncbi:P-selectin isoform X4 [Tympanuchus pallidicinctus]|uniref:P-selectin isoform X4 n=1 Tax=Tympanuchus pallidicinctus TaxID=109042 RepID=UPI0022875D76|nr:P-selectin isoform X4 [Tympanuchus pallidicinctus]
MWALGSCGVCCLGIAVFTCGVVMQVGAWTYYYSEEDYEWDDARTYCQTFFTDLVAIQNKEEIEYLNRTLPYHGKYYWIGIRKLRGIWTWVGTKKALTKEAANWATGEPNNRKFNQDCVEIYIKRSSEAGKWNDEPCTKKKKKALCYKVSCQPLICGLHGDCVEVIQSYKCECHPGFEGDKCENAVQCPILEPRGAYMNCSHPFGDFRYNSTCTFWCPEGFERRGADELQCLADRQWSVETPTCTAITCPELRAPEHAELNCSHLHGNFAFGSICDFSCQPGFELMGSQSHECMATGNWTGDIPRCKAVTCPVLSAPEHGELNCSHIHGNFTFGSTCDFSCLPGFELMGPLSHECTAMGTWTGDTPQCKAISCPVLRTLEHGELNCSHPHENFTFGSICDFSCQPGFELMGSQSHECMATGNWTGDIPRCKAVTCPVLSAPEHGELNCSHIHGDFTFGSTCDFSCLPGFELMGPVSHECTAMGTWTGDTPQCKAVTCPVLSAPKHGELNCSHLHGNFTFGSICDFSCQSGFELIGPESCECTAMGTWSKNTPQCKAITCPVLGAPEHGELNCSHIHGNFTFGSTCDFSCLPGFELMGPVSHECTAMGTWTGDTPQCKAITCSLLTAPEHGELNCSHVYEKFTFGSICDFSCQTGFELIGPQSRECMATGTWTGDTSQCQAISCPVLDAPSHGHLNCSHTHGNFTFNSTCSFSCKEGFIQMGAEMLRCSATGNWTRHPPVCEEDSAAFLKQVLVYTSTSALAAIGLVLSGTLIALLAKQLSDREEKKKLLNPTSDLGAPGIFTNAAYDSTL